MQWFKNMGIRAKMLISFMLVIALVMTLVVIVVNQMTRISDGYMVAINHPLSVESTLREFQAECRDVRRIVATMAAFADERQVDREALISDVSAIYGEALACLDEAQAVIRANPRLTREEKDTRTETVDVLRGLFEHYHDETVVPLVRAVRANDRPLSLSIIESSDAAALAVRDKIGEILELATGTAHDQVRKTENDALSTIALVLAISAGAALLAVAIALYMANFVGKPLGPVTEFMQNAATAGNFAFRPEDARIIEKFARNKDELGRAIAAAMAFVGRVTEIGRVLDKVAGGDLSSELPLLSDRDAMGLALNKMMNNLNVMFGEINASSAHVAVGANQVSDGAQALAMGASEQAASIEELSTSIAEVAERTKFNANVVEHAAKLASTIKSNAEKGSRRMDEMMTAVKQISEASLSIGKVIKTIDGLAFQTNILALNAAVEAARAGRHGKGFSVVAEEVRNLATKSAKAAKDTEALIANSVEKAELGVRMAEETSASLAEIVSGINQSNQLVSEIAVSSEEQSLNIAQINIGVDQMAQIVHQNSSTAEESAAASEEMSKQSVVLQDLILRFRLKKKPATRNRAARPMALPEPSANGKRSFDLVFRKNDP